MEFHLRHDADWHIADPTGGEILEIEFDFITHRLVLPHQPRRRTDDPARAKPVAAFHRAG